MRKVDRRGEVGRNKQSEPQHEARPVSVRLEDRSKPGRTICEINVSSSPGAEPFLRLAARVAIAHQKGVRKAMLDISLRKPVVVDAVRRAIMEKFEVDEVVFSATEHTVKVEVVQIRERIFRVRASRGEERSFLGVEVTLRWDGTGWRARPYIRNDYARHFFERYVSEKGFHTLHWEV